ncbi:Transferase, partial [Trema orientale]
MKLNIRHNSIMATQSKAHFLSEWRARLTRGELLLKKPFLDHKAAAFRAGEPPLAAAAWPGFDHSEDFCFLPFLIIKATEQRRVEEDENDYDHAKAFSRTAAHIWRCSSKARKHNEEQPTTFLVILNSKTCVTQPPLPLALLWQHIFDVAVNSFAGELTSKPLSYGASKIRAAIER